MGFTNVLSNPNLGEKTIGRRAEGCLLTVGHIVRIGLTAKVGKIPAAIGEFV